jgi:hypothetical protein
MLAATRRLTLWRPLLRLAPSGEQLNHILHSPHQLMCLFFRFSLSKIKQGLVRKRSAGYDATTYTCSHPKVLTLEHRRHAERIESRRTGMRNYRIFCSLFGKVWYKELAFEILVATRRFALRRFTLRRPFLRRNQSGEQLHPPLHCPHHVMCLFFRFSLSKIMQGQVSDRLDMMLLYARARIRKYLLLNTIGTPKGAKVGGLG